MKCFVYFNLHRKCWSLKAMEGEKRGKVIGHAKYVDMTNVAWKVSEAGRQRVLREKRKNVHAGAVGYVNKWLDLHGISHGTATPTMADGYMRSPTVADMVTYNPYRNSHFVDLDTGEQVKHTHAAFLCPERRVYVYGRAG
jgi:hypothetical protein